MTRYSMCHLERDNFNKKYKLGTRVQYWLGDPRRFDAEGETTTKSKAFVIKGDAYVMLQGVNHIVPIEYIKVVKGPVNCKTDVCHK